MRWVCTVAPAVVDVVGREGMAGRGGRIGKEGSGLGFGMKGGYGGKGLLGCVWMIGAGAGGGERGLGGKCDRG